MEPVGYPGKDHFPPMMIQNTIYSDKQSAGKAIIEACKAMTSPDPAMIGSYRGLEESGNLQFCYPVLGHLLEEFGLVKLRKDEHWAFHQYMKLKRKMEQLERLRIYQTGYVHCYESMRKISMRQR